MDNIAQEMLDTYNRALDIVHHADQDSYEYTCACITVAVYLRYVKGSLEEQLFQLVRHGPVWDGDVLSKSARDALLQAGLAVRVVVQGEFGYTAATYRAANVVSIAQQYNIFKFVETIPVSFKPPAC